MAKAVALLSGGLDSTLAVKLMVDQGIEVVALNFTSAFCTCDSGGASRGGCKSESRRVADEFGVPIKVITKGLDYMEIVRHPRFGYGKGINPCVDCRIFMFDKAREYMAEIGADFIITGEVLGQRPMSQRRDVFERIEKECGLEGLIVRPLCAHALEPTRAEKEGLVDRTRLLGVVGRSRREQIDLAETLDVVDYPCPSGGCLLTEKMFSRKVRDLLDHKEGLTTKDLLLLKAGRHFRQSGGAKVVVGRDEAENRRLRTLVQPGDTLVEPVGFHGPVALVCGQGAAGGAGGGGGGGGGGGANGAVGFAASLIMKYAGDKAGAVCRVHAACEGAPEEIGKIEEIEVRTPATDAEVERARIC